jgi:hypothetical protein
LRTYPSACYLWGFRYGLIKSAQGETPFFSGEVIRLKNPSDLYTLWGFINNLDYNLTYDVHDPEMANRVRPLWDQARRYITPLKELEPTDTRRGWAGEAPQIHQDYRRDRGLLNQLRNDVGLGSISGRKAAPLNWQAVQRQIANTPQLEAAMRAALAETLTDTEIQKLKVLPSDWSEFWPQYKKMRQSALSSSPGSGQVTPYDALYKFYDRVSYNLHKIYNNLAEQQNEWLKDPNKLRDALKELDAVLAKDPERWVRRMAMGSYAEPGLSRFFRDDYNRDARHMLNEKWVQKYNEFELERAKAIAEANKAEAAQFEAERKARAAASSEGWLGRAGKWMKAHKGLTAGIGIGTLGAGGLAAYGLSGSSRSSSPPPSPPPPPTNSWSQAALAGGALAGAGALGAYWLSRRKRNRPRWD